MLGGPDPAVASQQPCKLAVPTAITPPPCLASPPRRYANQIKRCDEMARQLRFFTSEVEKAGILVAPRLSSEQVCWLTGCCCLRVLARWSQVEACLAAEPKLSTPYALHGRSMHSPSPRPTLQGGLEFDALEGRLAQLESELLELNANSDRLHRSYNELLELQVRTRQAGAWAEGAACHMCTERASFAGPAASWSDGHSERSSGLMQVVLLHAAHVGMACSSCPPLLCCCAAGVGAGGRVL